MNARVTANISPFSPALKGRSGGAGANRTVCGNAVCVQLSYSPSRRPVGVCASRPTVHGGAKRRQWNTRLSALVTTSRVSKERQMNTKMLVSAVLLAASFGPAAAQTPPAAPAYLTLGGYTILCLRGTAGGLNPAQRVDVILSRVTPLLGNPKILPSDVVVYLPPADSRVNRYPVIYALGRRIVTVDPATVKASGLVQTPLQAATRWAKRLQQVLPRVNWRPSNAPDTKVPANPPLLVTPDFAQVGGQVASVNLRGKTVLKLRGPQTGGMTAAERADLLNARLERLASLPAASAPDAVQVAPPAGTVQVAPPAGTATLVFAGQPLITVTVQDAKAAGLADPQALALSWAKNLRLALASSAPILPAVPLGEPPAANALPPALVTPAAPPAAGSETPIAPAPAN